MQITITRKYFPTGTNGKLYINGVFQCYTIELPWLNNKPRSSCVPEGTYSFVLRISPKFHLHLLLQDVPGRSLILVHPANDALRELKGCIAPVTALCGPPGYGIGSRRALDKIINMILSDPGHDPFLITIEKEKDDA